MQKILYAAGNKTQSFLQLNRIVNSLKNYNVKTSAYSKSNINSNIDFCLDALLNFRSPNYGISFYNDNYKKYVKEIINFSPDLIISDLEIYTSLIAIDLKIPYYNVSPVLFYYAIDDQIKYNSKIYNNHSYLFNDNLEKKNFINKIISNAEKNLVYSCFCDVEFPLKLKKNFQYVRPDYFLSEYDDEDINLIIYNSNNKYFRDIKNVSDHYFTDFSKKYTKYIGKCKYFMHEGSMITLCDAFYNQKYSCIFPDIYNLENIINSYFSEYFGIGEIIDSEFNIKNKQNIKININNNVKFLFETL